MNSFFTLHNFLEVVKTQDLPSKFWQTLGDALCRSSVPLTATFDERQTSSTGIGWCGRLLILSLDL
jgi:hypothetical protein